MTSPDIKTRYCAMQAKGWLDNILCTRYRENKQLKNQQEFGMSNSDYLFYIVGFQLLPSSGVNRFVNKRMISTIHQIPTPPRVNNLPTAVPV